MISVEWNKLGKRFGLKWVFRDLNGVIPSGAHVVIRGSNGSGKSTFGKLLVVATESTEGEMSWNLNGSKVGIDEVPQLIAWSAPFMEVPEEMTVSEVIQFHNNFRESWSRPINRNKIPIGVKIVKKIIPNTIGLIIIPSNKPNFIKSLLRGSKISALIKVIINKTAVKIHSK